MWVAHFYKLTSEVVAKTKNMKCVVYFFVAIKICMDYITLKSVPLFQKKASDKSDTACKRGKHVCNLHWRQRNIMM